MATLGDILILVWSQKVRLEHVPVMRRLMEKIIASYQRGSSVHLMLNRPELPDKAVRDGLGALSHDYSDRTIASALVLNADGFWASAMRGLATSIHCIASKQRPFKFHVCKTAQEAANWLAPMHNASSVCLVDPRELESALATLAGRPTVLTSNHPSLQSWK